MDLAQQADGSHKVLNEYVLKGGSVIRLRITFKVHHDLVYGLKYCVQIKKLGIVVNKEEINVGSYGPTKESHVFTFPPQTVPSGIMARTTFHGKTIIADLDGTVHLKYDFTFKVDKNW